MVEYFYKSELSFYWIWKNFSDTLSYFLEGVYVCSIRSTHRSKFEQI